MCTARANIDDREVRVEALARTVARVWVDGEGADQPRRGQERDGDRDDRRRHPLRADLPIPAPLETVLVDPGRREPLELAFENVAEVSHRRAPSWLEVRSERHERATGRSTR